MGEFPAEVLRRQPFAKILCRQQVPALADWQWLLAKLAGLPVWISWLTSISRRKSPARVAGWVRRAVAQISLLNLLVLHRLPILSDLKGTAIMAKRTRILPCFGLLLCTAAAGCSASSSGADAIAPANSSSTANQAIAEADIISLDSGKLYALSAAGTVSVVDVSVPSQLALLGQTRMAGEPFEMYRRGDFLITMWNGSFSATGSANPPLPEQSNTRYVPPPPRDPNSGAAVVVIDVRDPSRIRPIATFPVPGELADSRIVGDVLYLATYQNAKCYNCGDTQRTVVTSFDLKNTLSLRQVDQMVFRSNAPDSYNLPWGSNWKRSLFVTNERLYVGGHADVDPRLYGDSAQSVKEGIIDVLDVTDPGGRLQLGARIEVAGAVLSRWQMEERDGVLRVISQRGAGRTGNGQGMPQVDTYSIVNTKTYLPLGHTSIKLPRQEGLRTVRFDKDRAYAITYNQTDPLFTIDLKNPAAPTVRGELTMPGFMYYLEPYGDRLIGLGVDRDDPRGSLNVSLFDVSNLDRPKMISRVPFGTPSVGEDYVVINYELPEDQDRIQKAFRVFPDGLVAVPFTDARVYYSGDACDSLRSGIQLMDWSGDSLMKRALLPVKGNPRRALELGSELLAVSDATVSTFSLADHDIARKTAELTIGTCTPRGLPENYGFDGEGDYYGFGLFGCTVGGPTVRPAQGAGAAVLLLLGLLLRLTGRRKSSLRA